MTEKYKIGDVSRLLGIPVQTLRYYEEQGIVHPKKNEATGYRYYDAWDLNSLMDSAYYRSLDFSLSQIEEMLNEDSFEEKVDRYTEQEMAILQKIRRYQEILSVLSAKRQQMQVFREDLDVLSIRKSPGLLFFRHRLRNRFQSAEGNADFAELKEDMKPWIEHIRVTTPTFLFPRLSLQEDGPEEMKYWWGWSMPILEAMDRGMESVSPNEYLPSCRCAYTVFRAGEEGSFAADFYRQVYQRIQEEELVICGNPFGRLILKVHEEGKLCRYFEIWIPIE